MYYQNKIISKMNTGNRNNLIKLYKQKSQNFQKIIRPHNLRIKKSFLQSKTNFQSTLNNTLNNQDHDDKFPDNSKIFYETNESSKPFILPSIHNNLNNIRTIMNHPLINNMNNRSNLKHRKRYTVKLKKIKIKKNLDRESLTPTNINKKILDLYKEDFQLKQKFEKYKERKAENMQNFSYEKYNLHLLKLSSINLSQDSYNIFKKNMQTIESNLKGQRIKRKNRWLLFLDKIGNFAPEGLKKKIKSLSEHKKIEEMNN